MLEVQALTYNDIPPVMPISGTITGNGATIGRSGDNIVVLPDPMHVVSRHHLKFTREAGSSVYRVDNVSGRNAVFVNGEELKPGNGRTLNDRDRIALGGYVLQVRYVSQGQANAPRSPASATATPEAPPDDDFLAVLLGPGAGKQTPPESAPEGDDPVSALMSGVGAGRRDPMQTLDERGIELGSLDGKGDELINGGDARAMARELLRDPLLGAAENPLARDASLDPLAMFGGGGGLFDDILQSGKNAGAAPHMDLSHGSELGDLFQLPKPAAPPAPTATPLAPSPPPGVATAQPPIPDDGVGIGELGNIDDLIAGLLAPSHTEEWAPSSPVPAAAEAFPPDGSGAVITGPRIAEPPPQKVIADDIPPSLPKDSAQTIANPETGLPPFQAQPALTGSGAPAALPAAEDLYKAFIEGLGVELPGRVSLDRAFMKTLGQMLRGCAQGTVDLIAGRAIVKQAVRASVTMIAPERNNPLKFSSDGHAALLYLLGKPFPGFMGPVDAIQNAFTDLRAHQIGVVSGMHSALNHVLRCFEPAAISDNEPPRGLLEQVLPSQRKARLWDAYEHYYVVTQENVADRFQDFFGAAFVKAYEDAISTLQLGEKAGK
ncbi:MAG: type VI secretion system-associated FHA domain protein TagH [Azoarcus sp.]|nr:type VI secretion system-associated FHA domain protein TagH [Azoarcus sp.]